MAGERGMQYDQKSFSVPMSSAATVEYTEEELKQAEELKSERKAESDRIHEQTRKQLEAKSNQKITRKLVPWGTRILVKRRKVEDKSSHIILPDEVKDLPTDIADVIEVPEQTMVDREVLRNAESIINALNIKAASGDAAALDSLLKFKEYLLIMTTKPGDVILMARYGGTDFLIQETNQTLCVTDHNGIYCRVVEKRS